MMPAEKDKNDDAKAANPSQGNVHPETGFFCQLTGCHGLTDEQALSYITVLKAWFSDILGEYVRKEELDALRARVGELENGCAKKEKVDNLHSRVKEIENYFARKGDVEKIVRDEFWFWGKVVLGIVLGIVSAIIVAIGSVLWFFWEKIHPLLIQLLSGQ